VKLEQKNWQLPVTMLPCITARYSCWQWNCNGKF